MKKKLEKKNGRNSLVCFPFFRYCCVYVIIIIIIIEMLLLLQQ